MTFIEFIGFAITMLAFFFLIVKQARDDRKRRQHPELYEDEERQQQEAVRDLLKSLNIEVPEEIPEVRSPPPPPPKKIEMPDFQKMEPHFANLKPTQQKKLFRDPYALRKTFEHKDAYLKRKEQHLHVKKLFKKTNSLKDAVILIEVLGKPKGLS